MLRTAGTSLHEKITALDESIGFGLLLAVLLPMVISFILVTDLTWSKIIPLPQAWTVLTLSAVPSLGVSLWLLYKVRQRGDYGLGYSGELAVAEHLQELARGGCYVFHDLQPEKTWNIDHIVVAPDSVLVIETKARRMQGNRKSEPAHEVTFDGRRLHFPNWTDVHGLAQAERNASWVRDYLSKALSEPVVTEPVLALPGWMVHRKGRGKVHVVNPKEVRALVRARGAQAISPEKAKRMKQIAFALEQKCRDVEF
jgi:hypothetical protein